MYACNRILVFAVGSSTDSLTGMGTRSISRESSCFSSSRTEIFEKSVDSAKSLRSSMSVRVGLRCSL